MRWVIRGLIGLLLIGAAWFSWQAYHVYQAVDSMTGQAVPRYTAEPTVVVPPLNGGKRINFLVLGSDNDKKKEEARPLTQSMIIVSLDPLNYKVSMLSIPRDFWVKIPGHGMGKIDLAHKYGGVPLARYTVEKLLGIPIHHYAWVGLGGFIKVIDTFGGITLNASYPILDDSYPNDLNAANPYGYKRVFIPAGWQHMNGDTALQYVRSRHGDFIGDFGRSQRQQQVLLQLDQKLNTLNVVFHLPELASELQGSVKTDLTLDQLYQLEQIAHHIHLQNVQQVVLQAPFYSQYGKAAGQDVVLPNWPRIHAEVKRLFAPVVPPPTSTPTPSASPTNVNHVAATTTPRAAPVSTARPVVSPQAKARPTSTKTTNSVSPSVQQIPARLIYVRGGNIFELLRTGSTRQLTFTGDATMPSMSPDGHTLAFVRFPRGAYYSDLWLLNLQTRKQYDLTHLPAKDVRNNVWAAWPAWLDRGHLVFSWDRGKLTQAPSDARPNDLAVWTVATNGTQLRPLTVPVPGGRGDTEPAPRPGKDQMVYVKWTYFPNTFQPYSQLVFTDLKTGKSTALTAPGGRVLDPQWDASGTRLVYIRRSISGADQVVDAPLTLVRSGPVLGKRTVLASGEVAQPAFTPNGASVSYLLGQGDTFNLHLEPAAGGRSSQVTGAPGDIDSRWRPIWTH